MGRKRNTRKVVFWMRDNTVCLVWNCNKIIRAKGVNLKRRTAYVDKAMRVLLMAFLRTMNKRWVGKGTSVYVDIHMNNHEKV